MLDRRLFLVAAPIAIAGCSTSKRDRINLNGAATPSNSVQLSASDADASMSFGIRLCRYPEAGVAWVWCNVYEGGRIWTYTDDQLALAGRTPEIAQTDVAYIQRDGAQIAWRRIGPRASPQRALVDAVLHMHRGGRVDHGPGPHLVRLRAEMTPASARDGMLPGRTEAKGLVNVSIELGPREIAFQGYGSWHEQPLARPRFIDPFVYFRGAGDGIGFTFSRFVGDGATGYLTLDNTTEAVTTFQISAPGPTRHYRVALASGREIFGEVTTVYDHAIRIYDDWRRTEIVRGSLDGRRYVGGINDWIGHRITYLPA